MELQTELISGTEDEDGGEGLHNPPPSSCAHGMSYFTPANHMQDRFRSFTEFLVSNLTEWSRSHPPWPPAPPPISLSGSADVFFKGRLPPHRTAAIALSLSSLISDENVLLSSAMDLDMVACKEPSSKDGNDRSSSAINGMLGVDGAKNCELSLETVVCSQSLTNDVIHEDVNNSPQKVGSSLQGPFTEVVDGYELGTDSTWACTNSRDKHDAEDFNFLHGMFSREVKAVETPLTAQPDACVALNKTTNQAVHAYSSLPILPLLAIDSGPDSSTNIGRDGQVGTQSGNGMPSLLRAGNQANGLPILSFPSPSMKPFSNEVKEPTPEKDSTPEKEPTPDKCPDALLLDDYEEGELLEKSLDDVDRRQDREYLEATSCASEVLEPVVDDGMNETIGCWLRRSSLGRGLTVKNHSLDESDFKTFKRKSLNKKPKIYSSEVVASQQAYANPDGTLVIFGKMTGEHDFTISEQVPPLEDVGGNLTMPAEANVGLLTANDENMKEIPGLTKVEKVKRKRGRSAFGMLRRKLRKKQQKEAKNEALGIRKLKFKATAAKKKEKVIQTCQFYIKGRCKKGASCKFSHDVMPETKLEICKYFLQRCCLRGEDCPYSHALSSFACKYFHMRGTCHAGESCRFSHEPLTKEMRQELAKRIEQEKAREELNMDKSRDATGGEPIPQSGQHSYNVETSAVVGGRVMDYKGARGVSGDMENSAHGTTTSACAAEKAGHGAYTDSVGLPCSMAGLDPLAPPARKEGGQVGTGPSIPSAVGVSGSWSATPTTAQDVKTRTRELLDAALAASQPLIRLKPTANLEGSRQNPISGVFHMANNKPSSASTSGDTRAGGTNLWPAISKTAGNGGAGSGDPHGKPDAAPASNKCNLLDYLLKK